ncbi:MAG: glycosyl hydrolase [Kiritimatiellia bacterium]
MTTRITRSPSAGNCSQAPFWFWNGPMDAPELARQVREMAAKGVRAAMPHPRFGMDRRDYLEAPYWKAFKAVVEQAARVGSKILLYDEYNWPSGGAGGRVTDGHPEFYTRGLDYQLRDVEGPGMIVIDTLIASEPECETPETAVAAFLVPMDCPLQASTIDASVPDSIAVQPWGRMAPDGFRISGDVPAGKHRAIVFFLARASSPSPLDGGSGSFVDYLNPKATKRFIDLTHEQYRQHLGRHFGKTITAIFTDEPQAMSSGPLPWTGDFAARFQKLRGYDLLPHVVALIDDRYPDGWQHRAAYWQTVAEVVDESFFAPIAKWCRKNNIAFTGHVYEENVGAWPAAAHLMNWLRRMDWPGIDALGERADPTGAKIAASVAHLEGKPHFLCESMGLANGWNTTLGTVKRGYNFLALMGVDVLVPHAFHQTVDNPRVECPPSYFFQNPYWKYYGALAGMTDRLCAFNQIGHHVAAIAVYYPIESLWADSTGGKGQAVMPWQCKNSGNAWAGVTINAFNDCLTAFSAREHDCDVVDAKALAGSTVQPGGTIRIGPETFSCIVLPAVRTIDPTALIRIDAFVRAGGTLLAIGQFPQRTYPDQDGKVVKSWFDGAPVPTAPGQWTIGRGRIILVSPGSKLSDALPEDLPRNIRFVEGNTSAMYAAVRRTDDATAWLVVNDRGKPLTVTIELPRHLVPDGAVSLSVMDPVTGCDCEQDFTTTEDGLRTTLQFDHTQALILTARIDASASGHTRAIARSSASRAAELQMPCVLNWTMQLVPTGLDSRWTDKPKDEWVSLPVWKACGRGWKRMAGWTEAGYDDSAWKQVATTRDRALLEDEVVLLRAHLPPGATAIKLPLPVSGEYILHVNGRQIEKRLGPPPKRGILDLSKWVKGIGDVIAIEVSAVQEYSGLTAAPEVLCGEVALPCLAGWDSLHLGWYAGRAVYRTTVTMPTMPIKPRGQVWLDLGRVEHYAEVWVNGHLATTLLWPPYRVEIGSFLQRGRNSIVLVVSNSLASRFLWDDWGTRGGGNCGVGPTPEASGLIGPVSLNTEC